MKRIILPLLIGMPFLASASGIINLQGTEFKSDTIAHYYIGPGTTHTHLQLTNKNRSVHVYAVTLDKSDPSYSPIAIPRVEIGKDQCRTAESISSMAKRKTTDKRQYIAGINGDFFITSSFAAQHEFGNAILGYPNMSCAIDGKLAAPDMIDISSRENALIIGKDNMWIDATDLTYKVLNNDGSIQVKATAVNYPRRDNEMIVYNSYGGESTQTAAGGREIALRIADGASWKINKTVKFVVEGQWETSGNKTIPSDGIVISCGKDYKNDFIDGLKAGDEIKLKIILSLPAFDNIKPDITDVIGGDVRILKEGVVTTEAIRWINTPGSQYPRSLVGYSQDRNKLVFAAVDGGTTISTGVSYFEGADLMAALGCYDALDFDGGGSTALYLSHIGIANKPRDGQERAVGNALYIAMDAPEDKDIASIRFADAAKLLPQYGSYSPVIYGYNKYGQLVDTNVTGAIFTSPEGTADIDNGQIIVTKPGCFALTATIGNMTASIAVNVIGDFTATPRFDNLLIDGEREVKIPIDAKVGADILPVAPEAFEWTSANPSIVDVDAQGILHGCSNGTTIVTGKRDNIELNIKVTVEIAEAPFKPLFTDFVQDEWKISRTGIAANPVIAHNSQNGLDISYKISNARGTKLTLAKAITAYGNPDAFTVTFNSPGTTIKNINVTLRPADQTRVTVLTNSVEKTDASIDFVLADYFQMDTPGAYPLYFTNISFEPVKGNSADCSLSLTNLGFKYDRYNSSVAEISVKSPEKLAAIVADGLIRVPASSKRIYIYSSQGQLISTSVGNEISAPLQKGIYIVCAELPGGLTSAKIML